jgi:hypothetical protein
MWFDREASTELFTALRDGPLRPLVARRDDHRLLLDIQLRRNVRDAKHSWVSLYAGLTTVLDVHEREGMVWLDAHPTHRAKGGFDPAWREPRSTAKIRNLWPRLDAYLDRVIAKLDPHHVDLEGKVHAALCSGYPTTFRVVNREASPAFSSERVKAKLIQGIGQPLREAISAVTSDEPWWPGVRYATKGKRFGTSPDVLAIDDAGRLLVIEAKPPAALEGIAWGPAQVRFYADLFAELFRNDPHAGESIRTMLEQRVTLGLTVSGRTTLTQPVRIAPILAIGAGRASRKTIGRAVTVLDALEEGASRRPSVAPAEIWLLDPSGEPSLVLR